ncbi:MAG TPA: acetolactate synthase large subunit, partial [Acidimicrobiales bacterium]|nr:acetolactate synthase large subunit [Acidimicrobiales bacterium]
MNGAEALVRTLVAHGVDHCFMNPGTSEMHFVATLDEVPEMHGVLATFEGVATGAADGFARLADRPAATLLHLGPGLGNGLANLHNARRAHSPVVNIVGDHALSHQRYDAQLQSDIQTVARNVSTFVRSSERTAEVGGDAADVLAAAVGPPGSVSTLILPADVSWSEGGVVRRPGPAEHPTARGRRPDEAAVDDAAKALRAGEPAALLLGGRACREPLLGQLAGLAAATGAKLLAETFPARLERGAGRPPVERLAYLAEFAAVQLDGLRHLVLVDARSPVSFFAYPGRASDLVPEGCTVHALVAPDDDAGAAVAALASSAGPAERPPRQELARSAVTAGPLTAQAVCQVLGALMPEGAIVSDEGNTAGLWAPGATAGAPPHDWLCLTGGAIGQGLPVAVGAATACRDRRVVALEADGSALYTLQSWWTMAREGLDVTTILLNNHSYAVLNMELDR